MDTVTIVCDTIAVKLIGMTSLSHAPVQESCLGGVELGIALIVCVTVVLIVCYGISKYYKDKEAERNFQINAGRGTAEIPPDTDNKPDKSPEEKEQEAEIKRQVRVADLMKEICELSQDPGTSKDIKGKYNNLQAYNLLKLYIKLDEYSKTGKFECLDENNDNETSRS